MTEQRLSAKTENREYFFTITDKKPQELSISMYNTPYILVQQTEGWRNHSNNKLAMAQHLIDAVMVAAGI